jgi:hypothetical protein
MKKTTYFTQSKSVEKMGFIPRSILRTFDRFQRQLWPGIENLVIREFQVSRSQFLVSIQALVYLLLIPLFFNFFGKEFIFKPAVNYFWNTQQSSLFLNPSQEERAFRQVEDFEQRLYFEALIMPPLKEETTKIPNLYFEEKIQKKYLELAVQYNNESIDAVTNLLTDILTVFAFWLVSLFMRPQLSILKSFLTEFLYSFGDTTKSFLLLFITDLFVGFHSPHGWEVFLEFLIQHFGFPENEDFIFLFVATFPVLLDTVIKYWIFRYLNKLSPSTVATYHTMTE